ncbi:MFS transporter [Mycobacterium conspicuum]|jgi:EmrB/QacA subfamily drug resistance transporter|uniref:MFS transporter n=1 Tax=Mycobacterium conspicuum TaxID=44010 RepID=A0A1X1TQE0_9MYCO|nr:MFS transporter [Mycobacterium conspicuum]ORV46790.1 MFS transporter [Mycobacterium conspicuum]BBZ40362.1 MFS transporter [Mycobacterium conspicuum]
MTSLPREGRSRWILAAVSTALFCVQIDYFAMNLSLPRMAADLHSTTSDLQWVISVYMLTLGAFMVPAGRIGDIFGRRRSLLGGIALFGVASVFCAIAPSAAVVIIFRAVQGIGAAFIFPVSVSVLTNAFPAGKSSHAIGLAYGIAGLGNAAGPLVGGLLTQTVGWRFVFWMLVPLAAVSLLVGAATIPETSDETVPRRLDLSGLALITTGIGLFTIAFDRAPSWGWLSAATVGAFVASVLVLAAFVVVEQRVRWPLVNLALLRNSKFSTLVVAGTIANIAYTVTVFLSTMNLQQVRGLDPLTAGIAFLGPSAGAALGGVISGRLAARYSPILVMGIGCAVAAVSLGVLAASAQWALYLVALTACGFTMGLVYAFTTVATQTVVAPERAGEAAGVTLTSLVTIAGVGIAVSGTVLEMLQRHGLSMGSGIQSILAVIAALLLPAGLAVLRSARSESAAAEPS